MQQKLNKMERSEVQYGPHPIGEILSNFFSSSKEPLAKGYREYLAFRKNHQKGGLYEK